MGSKEILQNDKRTSSGKNTTAPEDRFAQSWAAPEPEGTATFHSQRPPLAAASSLQMRTCGCAGGPTQLQHALCITCARKQKVWDFLQSERHDEAERAQPLPPLLPQDATIGPAVQIRSLSGLLLNEIEVDSAWGSDKEVDGHSLVRILKSLLQERIGIPVCEQRLIVDASWQHATLVRAASPELLVKIEEKIDVELQTDGALCSEAVCTGNFEVTALGPNASLAGFRLTPKHPRFKPKLHPNLNKKAFGEEDRLTVRDLLHLHWHVNRPSLLLKWQLKTNSSDFLPVSLVFSSATHSIHGTRSVLEMELKNKNVVIEEIHVSFSPSGNPPSDMNADMGEATFRDSRVLWQVPALNANESKCKLELCDVVDAMSTGPIVFFALSRCHSWSPIEILECYNQETKEGIRFECEKIQKYNIVLNQIQA